jgi:hypothetical protein
MNVTLVSYQKVDLWWNCLLSKLRISNHNLEIERGRHRGLQARERICKLCLKEVEDEIHFLLKW